MIEVMQLTQTYRNGKGVFDLDFVVGEGEAFGYLGPNGAGKTTTIRSLLGFTNAEKGSATINGLDCRREAATLQGMIGYLPGEITFLDSMTGFQFLKFVGEMRRTKDHSKRDDLIDRLALDTEGAIKKMSKGMKQKLALVTAFMHDPAVYILDEPTSGLDPFMQNVFMEILDEEKTRGKTILMSSHLFDEVERGCDRAGILREGRLVAVEDLKSLSAARQTTYVVSLERPADADRLLQGNLNAERLSENRVRVTVRDNYQQLFRELSDVRVSGFAAEQQSLEGIFMKYYGRNGARNE